MRKLQNWLRLCIQLLLLLFLISEGPLALAAETPVNTKQTLEKKKKRKHKVRKPQSEEQPYAQLLKKRRRAFENHLQTERHRERDSLHVVNPFKLIDHTFEGSLRLETRHFTSPAQDPRSINNNIALLGEFEGNFDYKEFSAKVWNLGRVDFSDDKRSRILPYENWLSYKNNDLKIKLGMQIENWSMSEIFHPSDVFNSRNIDSDLENTEKIGEPSASVRWKAWDGFATVYFMPLFWSPIFPSEVSRLSALPPGSKMLPAVFLSQGELNENDSFVNQYAFRYTHSFGTADIAFHYLNAIDRQEALYALDPVDVGIRPVFLPVKQIGTNGTIIYKNTIYKFDIVHRTFTNGSDLILGKLEQPTHSIASLGMEHTLTLSSGEEVTLYSEWQKILGVTGTQARQLSIFQHDLMVGSRLSFNDLKSRELKAFFIIDLDSTSETVWSLSYSQKLSANLKLAAGFRGISVIKGVSKELNDADHIFVNMTYFFDK